MKNNRETTRDIPSQTGKPTYIHIKDRISLFSPFSPEAPVHVKEDTQ